MPTVFFGRSWFRQPAPRSHSRIWSLVQLPGSRIFGSKWSRALLQMVWSHCISLELFCPATATSNYLLNGHDACHKPEWIKRLVRGKDVYIYIIIHSGSPVWNGTIQYHFSALFQPFCFPSVFQHVMGATMLRCGIPLAGPLAPPFILACNLLRYGFGKAFIGLNRRGIGLAGWQSILHKL